MYSSERNNKTVVLCAIVKDEADLEEWVAYNLLIGFEHIYIYDNDSRFAIADRLAAYRDVVNVIPWPGRAQQMPAYNHFVENFRNRSTWAAFFDADEYLVLKKHRSVGELIECFCGEPGCDGLLIHWVMFGTCGHIERPPGLVMENYRWCLLKRQVDSNTNRNVKSIVRLEGVNGPAVHPHSLPVGGHYCLPNRTMIHDRSPFMADWISPDGQSSMDIAQLNHYWLRSAEECALKWSRTRGGSLSRRNINEFIYLERAPKEEDSYLAASEYPERVRSMLANIGIKPLPAREIPSWHTLPSTVLRFCLLSGRKPGWVGVGKTAAFRHGKSDSKPGGSQRFSELLERFDEIEYLKHNPDVAQAVARGECLSGLEHFAAWGFKEGRPGITPNVRDELAGFFELGMANPLPPPHLMERVHGSSDGNSFDMLGRAIAMDIYTALSPLRVPANGDRMLDFGCGCGRTLRYLAGLFAGCRITGADVDSEAIEWNRRNLGGMVEFTTNDDRPPLVFDDDTFDFVTAISVFTHLPEDLQDLWLAELSRVTKPGGLLLLTIHSEALLAESVQDAQALLGESGFYYQEGKKTPGLPDYYQTAYHREDYVRNHWGRYFEILEICAKGIARRQDWALCRKRD